MSNFFNALHCTYLQLCHDVELRQPNTGWQVCSIKVFDSGKLMHCLKKKFALNKYLPLFITKRWFIVGSILADHCVPCPIVRPEKVGDRLGCLHKSWLV